MSLFANCNSYTQTKKQQGCSALTGALIGLTLNALMPGLGETIIASMGRAALVALSGKAVQAAADHRGHLGKIMSDLTSDQMFKNVLVSAGSAGLTSGAQASGMLPKDATWIAEASRQSAHESASAVMRGVVFQEKPELDQLALNVMASTVQTMGATAVGQAKAVNGKPGLNYVEHKLGHFIVGAGAESIRSIKSNDIVTNMIVAGSSAAMAEMLVEQWTNVRGTYERLHQENPNMDQPEFIRKVQAETAGARTAAHLVTATLAGIGSELANPGSGASAVHVASQAAQTALDNNFLPGALMLAGMAWSAYKTYDMACTLGEYLEVYREGGLEAVMAKAAHDGAMRLIFGGAFKVGGDLVMKVGGKLYRLCPAGVQELGEHGYKQVYKAVKKAEEHAFFKQTLKDEARFGGRGGNSAACPVSHQKQTKIGIPKPEDRPLSSAYYSTAFQAKLEPGVHYPGKGDAVHFREANKQLYEKLSADKGFATKMETLYPGITKAVSPGPKGGFPKDAPASVGLTWHHSAHEVGAVELIPYAHHKTKGPVNFNLHPRGKGGQEIWGKGRKKGE